MKLELVCPRFVASSVHSRLEMGYFKGFDELISFGDAPNHRGVNESEVLIETSLYT